MYEKPFKYNEETKLKILELAKTARTLKQITDSLNMLYPNIYILLDRFGIRDTVKKMIKQNRLDNPKLLNKYSRSFIFELAGTCVSLHHMGKRMSGLCRERVRQIAELYNIEDEIHSIFVANRLRMVMLLEKAEPLKLEDVKLWESRESLSLYRAD